GASCASACAMILFVSGAFRTVESGGRLGVHTCHDSASGSRSVACNEVIAQNALKHGVPYTTSLTLMHLTAPGEGRWLDAAGAGAPPRAPRPPPPPRAPPAPGAPPVAPPPGRRR